MLIFTRIYLEEHPLEGAPELCAVEDDISFRFEFSPLRPFLQSCWEGISLAFVFGLCRKG